MPIQYIQIATFDNYLLANMTLGLLQDNFVHCHLKDEYIVTIDPLLNPAVGGIKLMVAEAQVSRARDLITEAEKNYLARKPCPHCGHTALVTEEKVNAPATFWGKLLNRLAYGQEVVRSKKFRCTHCHQLYSRLPA